MSAETINACLERARQLRHDPEATVVGWAQLLSDAASLDAQVLWDYLKDAPPEAGWLALNWRLAPMAVQRALALPAYKRALCLSDVDLRGVLLSEVFPDPATPREYWVVWTYAWLDAARMEGASMGGVDLSEARLNGAALGGAALYRATLEFAELEGADLRGAYLHGAKLTCAGLRGADLRDADLTDAVLNEVDLRDADLRGATLRKAQLMRADLRGANLEGADLRRAELAYASLQRADLRSANLQDARLDESDLSHADLRGAKREGARLVDAYTYKTRFDPKR